MVLWHIAIPVKTKYINYSLNIFSLSSINDSIKRHKTQQNLSSAMNPVKCQKSSPGIVTCGTNNPLSCHYLMVVIVALPSILTTYVHGVLAFKIFIRIHQPIQFHVCYFVLGKCGVQNEKEVLSIITEYSVNSRICYVHW